jgi:hypothetical protein
MGSQSAQLFQDALGPPHSVLGALADAKRHCEALERFLPPNEINDPNALEDVLMTYEREKSAIEQAKGYCRSRDGHGVDTAPFSELDDRLNKLAIASRHNQALREWKDKFPTIAKLLSG